ncbi:hypothetical protein BH11ARM2_BH11ARM2_26350 [soil metagenome]
MIGLRDSDVLIDVQRALPVATAWLASYTDPLALPAAVALELLMGARNKEELAKNERSLRHFDVEPFDAADTALAQRLVSAHRLTTGLGLGDYLIGNTQPYSKWNVARSSCNLNCSVKPHSLFVLLRCI